MPDTDDFLDFAVHFSGVGGALLVQLRDSQSVQVNAKGSFDFVTNADIEIDQAFRLAVADRFPSHNVYSEEGARTSLSTEGYCWIIDPLDGTMNYLHGLHHVAISIALYQGGKPLLGVVRAPFYDELFWAVAGGGAFRNGNPLPPVRERSNKQSLIATGFPHERKNLSPLVDRLKPILGTFGDIRRLAAPALDICWVADGRLDGFVDRIHIWDVAAAGLIATEAGAVVTEVSAAESDGIDYVVARAGLSAEILALLREAATVKGSGPCSTTSAR